MKFAGDTKISRYHPYPEKGVIFPIKVSYVLDEIKTNGIKYSYTKYEFKVAH